MYLSRNISFEPYLNHFLKKKSLFGKVNYQSNSPLFLRQNHTRPKKQTSQDINKYILACPDLDDFLIFFFLLLSLFYSSNFNLIRLVGDSSDVGEQGVGCLDGNEEYDLGDDGEEVDSGDGLDELPTWDGDDGGDGDGDGEDDEEEAELSHDFLLLKHLSCLCICPSPNM